MPSKVDNGFCQAQSDNLPKVDFLMVAEFLQKNECFSISEIRGVKEDSAGRESYGDSAIGYVQVRREKDICTVKWKICPEHRVRAQNYNVVLEVDERENNVLKVECMDCAAAAGGCKHSIAFLMWTHRRSEEPACTEVQCYWKKAQLAKVGTAIKFLTVEAFGGVPSVQPVNNFLEESLNLGIQQNAAGEILKLYKEPKFRCLSLYSLILKFTNAGRSDCGNFIEFCQQQMSSNLCDEAALCTIKQADDNLWHQLRYGRITASKLYTAAHCHQEYGSFVQQVIGVTKLRDTKAMERGRHLEKEVLKVLQSNLKCQFTYMGIVLSKENPLFGASPDAVFKNHVVEVKCPSSTKTVGNYLTQEGKITAKYRAQVQLQMHILKQQRCIFSVADPNFEETKKLTNISVAYDEQYIKTIMNAAEIFWKKCIFPVLLQSVQK